VLITRWKGFKGFLVTGADDLTVEDGPIQPNAAHKQKGRISYCQCVLFQQLISS
jgi:hypothetical protein